MAIEYNYATDYDSSDYTYNGGAVTSISINGIHGQTFADGTEELIVVWNDHPFVYSSGWNCQPITLTTNTDCYFDSFLDHVFMVNGTDSNYSYDGTTWSATTNLQDSPIAKFVKEHNTRLYLYNISIGGTIDKPSWVWYSDLPKNGQITWGLEYGTNLVTTAASAEVTSAGSTFVSNNVKVGDPLVITTGDNAGEYTVQSVDAETTITLTADLDNTDSGDTFWVGGNYFEVATQDGDSGNGLAETSNELFCFKTDSLFRFNASATELRKVKTAPGTTSSRSIVESGGYVYWYHPSGIYRTIGQDAQLISNSIEDAIEGVDSDNHDIVCGWKNDIDKTVNMYLGNVTLRDGDVIEKCVASFDENSETMSFRSYDKVVNVATGWLESNIPKVYAGNKTSTVFQLDTGNDFDGNPIPFELEFKPIFPAGSEAIATFDRLRLYIENGPDVQAVYKLLYKPTKREDVWINDKDWQSLQGSQRGERGEWYFPSGTRASGVKVKLIETSTDESFLFEKLVIYYSDVANK